MEQLQDELKNTIEKVHSLMETIYKLVEPGDVVSKFEQVVGSLVVINSLKDECKNVYVPLELISIVDTGESVDSYFSSMLEHTKEMNSAVNGRVKNLKHFKSKLQEKLML